MLKNDLNDRFCSSIWIGLKLTFRNRCEQLLDKGAKLTRLIFTLVT